MPRSQVESRVEGALPPWATTANVTVVDDAAQERVITAELEVLPDQIRLVDPQQLLYTLIAQQIKLSMEGGRVGRVIAKARNALNGQPLYVGGADPFLGYVSHWYSPLVRGIAGSDPAIAASTGNATIDDPVLEGRSDVEEVLP